MADGPHHPPPSAAVGIYFLVQERDVLSGMFSCVCRANLSFQLRLAVTHWVFAGLVRPCFVFRGISEKLEQSPRCRVESLPWILILISEVCFQKKRKSFFLKIIKIFISTPVYGMKNVVVFLILLPQFRKSNMVKWTERKWN